MVRMWAKVSVSMHGKFEFPICNQGESTHAFLAVYSAVGQKEKGRIEALKLSVNKKWTQTLL